jgi:hypothetical protein
MTAVPDLKVIAFYLPQFHPIPENDLWWGKGFTEWTNVAKAQPLFDGHYQPHLPADLGFYDLRVPEVRWQQVGLAREYGIHGFCYYYYWFSGRRILERPLNYFAADTALDFPFCVCWANENWTRRWDGAGHEILLEQKYSEADDVAIIRDLIPLFKDPRYIRVGGAPLLLVYRVDELPDARRTAQTWRREAARRGLPALHLCAVESRPIGHPADHGCDSVVEFPPHGVDTENHASAVQQQCPNFTGVVRDYRDVAQRSIRRPDPPYRLFRGVCPSWDNTPRTGRRATIFTHSSPREYELWLHAAAEYTCQHQPPGERLLFVNAWNEWAEGAHLEPDQRHGRQFLAATRRVVEGQCHWRSLLSTLKAAEGLPPPRASELLDELGLILEGRDRAVAYLRGQVASTAKTPARKVTFLEQAMVPGFKIPARVDGRVYLDSVAPRGAGGAAVLSHGKPATFQGWAFVEGRAITRKSGLILVLVNQARGDCYFAHVPQRQERPDVCAAFPHVDAACTYWSGFDVEAETDGLPAGVYDVGIIQLEEASERGADLLPASEGAVVASLPIKLEVPAPDAVARAA